MKLVKFRGREYEEKEIAETEVIFHNKVDIRVQVQIYVGRTLVSTCVVDPGEIRALSTKSLRYDVFFKNGATGWEVARKLNSDASTFTLSQNKGRYTLHEAQGNNPLESVAKSDLDAKRSKK